MTETNAAGTDLGLRAGLARTRFAVRTAMVVERGWPLVLPLLLECHAVENEEEGVVERTADRG